MVIKSMQGCITCEIFFDQDKKIRFNWMEIEGQDQVLRGGL